MVIEAPTDSLRRRARVVHRVKKSAVHFLRRSPGQDRVASGGNHAVVRLVVWLLPIALIASCGASGTRILEVSGEPGSRSLDLGVASCTAEKLWADVEETGEEVRILVHSEGGDEGPQCRDGLRVTLDEPLGSRRVVDRSTGDALDVKSPDS